MKKVKILALIAAIFTASLVFVFFNSLNDNKVGKKAGNPIVAQNIPTDTSKLVAEGDSKESSLSHILKTGMRAITIAVDGVSGVGYMLEPGNHVDIIAQYNIDETAYTNLIAQNLTILAVDSNFSGKEKSDKKQIPYSTVTLQATPEQAMDISYYEFTGQLCTVLRSPLDKN